MAVKFTPQMLSKLKSEYDKVKMISVVTPEYKKLKAFVQSLPNSEKQKLIDADIKWLKNIAKMTMKEEGGSGEFSASQLKKLHEEYTTIDKKGITEEVLVEMGNTLSDIPNKGLEQLSEAGIPILSQMAKIVLNAK